MLAGELSKQLHTLKSVINSISEKDYVQNCVMLGNASIGQHTRHILELVKELLNGYENGIVNYDARKRDIRIENSQNFASELIDELIPELSKNNKEIQIETLTAPKDELIPSYFSREIHYNTEHAIHHMALIGVALRELQIHVADEEFGYAPSTIEYRKTLNSSN